MMISSSITAWFRDLFACIGNCFGCQMKPTPIIAVDEPAKGLRIRGQTVRKPTISDGFWSSSTCDLDNNTVQSQRSITTVSTLNQLFYHSSELSPAGTHPEFVNQGLLLWNESRIQWVGGSRSEKQNKQKKEPTLKNATYDSLLGTKQPFPRPVPLSVGDIRSSVLAATVDKSKGVEIEASICESRPSYNSFCSSFVKVPYRK